MCSLLILSLVYLWLRFLPFFAFLVFYFLLFFCSFFEIFVIFFQLSHVRFCLFACLFDSFRLFFLFWFVHTKTLQINSHYDLDSFVLCRLNCIDNTMEIGSFFFSLCRSAVIFTCTYTNEMRMKTTRRERIKKNTELEKKEAKLRNSLEIGAIFAYE